MQTDIAPFVADSPHGSVAESILRKCVHCGFCNATCPTYLLLGNELDSPRGRIYLMKQVLEGQSATRTTQLHLDRCLTCRSCETTCPSGVEYGRLLEIGREIVDQQVPRRLLDRIFRSVVKFVVPNTFLITMILFLGQSFRYVIPKTYRSKIPKRESAPDWPTALHERRMIIHQGCIQKVAKPSINAAAARYLDACGVTGVRTSDSCCGALGLHLGDRDFLEHHAKRNIDAWWPHIESGAEAIVSTASGCGVTIKEYAELLRHDTEYAEKAHRISNMTKDVAEIASQESVPVLLKSSLYKKVVFQTPCTLQHGQKIIDNVEKVLARHQVVTTPVANAHLCCGSAGVYSILHPEIAQQLLDNKIVALMQGAPECIVTANIGCMMHLESKSQIPVKHWIEVIAPQ